MSASNSLNKPSTSFPTCKASKRVAAFLHACSDSAFWSTWSCTHDVRGPVHHEIHSWPAREELCHWDSNRSCLSKSQPGQPLGTGGEALCLVEVNSIWEIHPCPWVMTALDVCRKSRTDYVPHCLLGLWKSWGVAIWNYNTNEIFPIDFRKRNEERERERSSS